MAYIGMAYIVMAYIVMASIVTTYIVMDHIVMAYQAQPPCGEASRAQPERHNVPDAAQRQQRTPTELHRTFDRTFDRTVARTVARTVDIIVARTFDRTVPRTFGRKVAGSFDRTVARPLDRTVDRTFARTFDRMLDGTSKILSYVRIVISNVRWDLVDQSEAEQRRSEVGRPDADRLQHRRRRAEPGPFEDARRKVELGGARGVRCVRRVSSRLVSSGLVSSRLVWSGLVSSRLVSSRLFSSGLVSSRLVSQTRP